MSKRQQFPKTYVAYRFEETNGPLVRVEMPWKDPQEDEVVIKVLATGVCGSDTCMHMGLMRNPWPRVPGHEVVGEVVSLHPTVTTFKLGQRVGAPWNSGHCGACRYCRSGIFTGCVDRRVYTLGGFKDGGYAEYCAVHVDGLCSIPEQLDPVETAPMMCAGVTVYKSLLYLKVPAGATVAVQGIGGLGHLAIQFCRAMGYKTVVVSSSSAKRELALELGAHVYIDESTVNAVEELQKLGGADVVMSTVPSGPGTLRLLQGLAYEGKLLVLGLSGETATFLPMLLPPTRWSIHGFLCGTAKDCEDTVQFAQLHGIKCIVERFPLEKAWDAFQHREKARFRAVIVP